jgi:prepilin-type N-terminal cleavage/methylation domain-containing protein
MGFPSKSSPAGRAFTLMEMLVVISIMTLLISITLPSLGRSRVQARRVICASNLRQFGSVFTMYSDDNRGQLLRIVRDGNLPTANPLPPVTWKGKKYNSFDSSPFLNFEAISIYIPGVDINNKLIEGMWRCPDFDPKKITNYGGWWDLDVEWSWGRNITGYSYFARMEEWQQADGGGDSGQYANFYKDMVHTQMLEGRLLMADLTFKWWVTNQWGYTHGRRGQVAFSNGPSNPFEMEGMNQLYGDCSARWKPASRWELEAMDVQSPTCGRVSQLDKTYYLR